MTTRRLSLRRETLATLSTDELATVAGAAGAAAGHTDPLVYCLLSDALGGCRYTSPCTT